nr:aminoglycoside efflux pump [Raoultella sp. NCTC 9187]
MVFLFMHLPTSFLPQEDRGMFTTSVQLPAGSTQQQTLKVVQEAEDYFLKNEKTNVESVFATIGSGPGGNRPERGANVRAPEGLGPAGPHQRLRLCHYRTGDQSL